eukprot:NODE_478_length_7890_cov_0.158388.p1 type:complete len:631 gc:universal NODE_478_length_7890_cov_0.158388:4614-2722(-)
MTTIFDGLFSQDIDVKKSTIIKLQSQNLELEDRKKFLKILIHLAYESREVIKRTTARAISNIIIDIPILKDFKQLEVFANYLILESTPSCRIAAVTIWATMAKQATSRHAVDFLYDTISNIALDPSVLVREHVYKSLSNFTSITDSYKIYTIEYKPREREYVNSKGEIKRQIPELANPGLFGVLIQGLEDESINIRVYSLDCIKQLCTNSITFATESLYLVIDQLGDAVHPVRIRASEVFLHLMKTYELTLHSDDIDPISKVIRSPLHDIRQNIVSGLAYAILASLEDLLMLLESLCYIAQLHSSEQESFLRIAKQLGHNNKQLAPRLLAECRNFRSGYNLQLLKDLIPLAAFFNMSNEFTVAYQGEFLYFKSKYPSMLKEDVNSERDRLLQYLFDCFNKLQFSTDQYSIILELKKLLDFETRSANILFLKQLLLVFTEIDRKGFNEHIMSLLCCFYNYDDLLRSKLSQMLSATPSKELLMQLLPLDKQLKSVQKYEIDMDYTLTTEAAPLQYYYCMPNLFEFSCILPESLGLYHIYCRFEFKEEIHWYVPCSRKMTFAGDVEYQFKIKIDFFKSATRATLAKTVLYCTTVEYLENLNKPLSTQLTNESELSHKFKITEEIEHYFIANPI